MRVGEGNLRKGMKTDTELWITEVNQQIHKNYSAAGGKGTGMTKKHTEVMEFIKENVSRHR